MKFTNLATAAAAFALLGGAAYAQQPAQPAPDPSATTSATTDTAVNPPADTSTPASTSATTSAAPDTAPVASSATSFASGVSVTTTTLTNGPVPDTAENRAKYGQPMSHAGKRTAAKGN